MTCPIAYPTPASHAHRWYQPQQREKKNGTKQSPSRRTRNRPKCKANSTTFTDGQIQTELLQSCLEAQGNQPSKHDDEFRLRVINDLEVLLNRWVTSIRPFQDKNQLSAPSNKKWARPKVCLLPFGSYRLGVHRKDADLDCLCLAPPASSRREFFTSLIKLLNDDDRVQQVHAISSAYTPVIKFLFQGLHMDLLFARLEDGTKLAHHQSLVDGRRMEYAIDDADLMGLDEASVRSLNGGRVAQTLLNIVPNVDTFRMTLRAIKEWALVHGLYSNVLGFLGGVNFAIQVAFICKRHHKDTTPAALLKAFFSTFAKWKWPMPVTVVPISYQPPQGVLPMTVWNAKSNARDAQCLMPILTPCYPSMNSSYNVGVPQKRRLQMELATASLILERIEKGEKMWNDLYHGNDFFDQYIYFMQVNISADNSTTFLEWFRFCESRLRLLIAGLEAPDYGVQVFPFAKFFDQRFDDKGQNLGVGKSDPKNRHESSFFMGLRFAHCVETIDLRFCTAEFLHKVNTWDCRREGMDLTIELVRQEDLPAFVKNQNIVAPVPSEASAASVAACNGQVAGTIHVVENDESATATNEADKPEEVKEASRTKGAEKVEEEQVTEIAASNETGTRKDGQVIEITAANEASELHDGPISKIAAPNESGKVEEGQATELCETGELKEGKVMETKNVTKDTGKLQEERDTETTATNETGKPEEGPVTEITAEKETYAAELRTDADRLPSINQAPRKVERNYAAVLLHGASPSKRPRT